MKTMTCKELGGACDIEFKAETFDEIAKLSQKHGIEMFQEGDEAHIEAMDKMQELMQDPNAMQEWIDKKQKEFENRI
jgi:hypothetical protein